MKNFIDLVAELMFTHDLDVDSPTVVQETMIEYRDLLRLLEQDETVFKLRLQANVEIEKHIQIYGHLT